MINYNRNQDEAMKTRQDAETHGVKALEIQADVSDREQVDKMVASTISEMGKIDILVNNAGVWEHNPIDDFSDSTFKRTIDINLIGCFNTVLALIPHMIERRTGSIINISSTAGQRGEPFYSPYAATKGALISLTKSWAVEFAAHNIRVNCVAPGWVETDMSIPSLKTEGDKVVSLIPLGRVGRPEELAGPILFLASEMATFITGEILNVNGGAVLCG
jgi:3-oxoacyl-[acyl-carrier protein] reductase